jgi:hypothetical protein
MDLSAVNARLERTEVTLQRLMALVETLAAQQSATPPSDPSTARPGDTTTTGDAREEKDRESPSTPSHHSPTTVVRSLSLSGLLSPVSASRNTVNLQAGTRITAPLPAIYELPAASSAGLSAEEGRRKKLETLQKGMMKPPSFEGNMGEKGESISTWWKQMGNWARVFDDSDRAMVIKSFLRGPAALWLESFERQIGRELTVVELADGLTQEYGRETTSDEALQKLETLTMSSPGCSTLQEYNATYNRYYNKCSANTIPIAVRCYIKGLLPKYMKHIEMTDDIYTSLPAARAAATKAVAKYDMLQLSYINHDLQTARASSRRESNGGTSSEHSSAVSLSNYKRSTEGTQIGGNQNLNAFSILAPPDDDDDRDESNRSADMGEAQVAAVAATATRAFSQKQTGLRLTPEHRDLLRRERRCFKCHKVGHLKQSCRSQAATIPPVALNPSAPSRT